jgi:hypothetical protein
MAVGGEGRMEELGGFFSVVFLGVFFIFFERFSISMFFH